MCLTIEIICITRLSKQLHVCFVVFVESPYPVNMGLAICLAAYVNGDHTNYEIDPSTGVEASELYPDVKYITLDQYFEENHDRTPFYLNWLLSLNKEQHFN